MSLDRGPCGSEYGIQIPCMFFAERRGSKRAAGALEARHLSTARRSEGRSASPACRALSGTGTPPPPRLLLASEGPSPHAAQADPRAAALRDPAALREQAAEMPEAVNSLVDWLRGQGGDVNPCITISRWPRTKGPPGQRAPRAKGPPGGKLARGSSVVSGGAPLGHSRASRHSPFRQGIRSRSPRGCIVVNGR